MRRLVCAVLLAALAAGCGNSGAVRPRPLQTEVRRSPWQQGEFRGTRLETAHYRILTTSASRPLLEQLPAFFEACWDEYHTLTGLPVRPPERPLTVYLFATWQQWAEVTRHIVQGPNAQKVLSMQAGGYFQPGQEKGQGACVFWNIGGMAALSVAAHEGMHQFFDARLTDQLPMWVEEGLCTVVEGYTIDRGAVLFTPSQNAQRWNQLRDVIVAERWTPLETLLRMDAGEAIGGRPDAALGYYAQLWALMQWIRSDPQLRKGLEGLLADAEAGTLSSGLGVEANLNPRSRAYNRRIGPAAMRHYFGDDLAGLERRYRRFARDLARLPADPQG